MDVIYAEMSMIRIAGVENLMKPGRAIEKIPDVWVLSSVRKIGMF